MANIIEDHGRLEFHIKQGDYFGTLATVLDLMRQDIESRERRGRNTRLLEKLRDELLHLQRHYEIVQRRSEKSPWFKAE